MMSGVAPSQPSSSAYPPPPGGSQFSVVQPPLQATSYVVSGAGAAPSQTSYTVQLPPTSSAGPMVSTPRYEYVSSTHPQTTTQVHLSSQPGVAPTVSTHNTPVMTTAQPLSTVYHTSAGGPSAHGTIGGTTILVSPRSGHVINPPPAYPGHSPVGVPPSSSHYVAPRPPSFGPGSGPAVVSSSPVGAPVSTTYQY